MVKELIKALEERKAQLVTDVAAKRQALVNNPDARLDRDVSEMERQLSAINPDTIREYRALWQSFAPGQPMVCPFCFAFHKTRSSLKPSARAGEVEQVKCTVCQETFEIPIELLYA